MLQGLPVTIGGVVHTMPPLNAKASKLYWPRMLAMQNGQEEDPLGLVSEVVLACLRRNYPELPADAVDDLVDFDNFEELMAKVTGQGAFRRWMAQQQASLGNQTTQPAPLAAAGTGEPSTPASPPPPGIDTPTSTS